MTTPFSTIYKDLLRRLLEAPVETNKRTGTQVAVIPGESFKIHLGEGLLPVSGGRRLRPAVAALEVAWFLMGVKEAKWIQERSKIWDKFVEADGTISAAYGYRWRHHFGRDQLALAIQALRDDPSDRRVVVSAWDPSTDGLGAKGQRSIPCPTHFTFCIVGGALHSSLFLRSSDSFVGLPYDVMGHAFLMDAVAAELGVPLGTMHVTMAHLHLYDIHWSMAVEATHRSSYDGVRTVLRLPKVSVSEIEKSPEEYFKDVKERSLIANWPSYDPRPGVVP